MLAVAKLQGMELNRSDSSSEAASRARSAADDTRGFPLKTQLNLTVALTVGLPLTLPPSLIIIRISAHNEGQPDQSSLLPFFL